MRVLSTSLITSLLLQAGAEAAEFELNPVVIVGTTEVIIPTHMTNNDDGAVYNSATVKAYASLAQAVFALGSHGFGSVAEMMGSWNYNLTGEVSSGWSGAGANDGTIRLTNNGVWDFGVPVYDVWQSTSTDSSQNEMSLNLGVPISQLELNATSGYQPFALADVQAAGWDATLYDPVIVRSDSALLQAGNYTGSPSRRASGRECSWGMRGSSTTLPAAWCMCCWCPGTSRSGRIFQAVIRRWQRAEDANGNGRSNFLDYASGQDPEAAGLLPVVELSGRTLTLRRRINGQDAAAVAEYSDNLEDWYPLEDGLGVASRPTGGEVFPAGLRGLRKSELQSVSFSFPISSS